MTIATVGTPLSTPVGRESAGTPLDSDWAHSAISAPAKVASGAYWIYDQTWNRFQNVAGTAGRHAIDTVGAMGVPGLTWDRQDAFQNDYKPDQRFGATIGDTMGVVLPSVLYSYWASSGKPLPQILKPLQTPVTGALVGAAAVASGVSLYKSYQDADSQGDFGATGAAMGGIAAFGATRSWKNRWGIGAAVLAGGTAGFAAGTLPKHAKIERLEPIGAAMGALTAFSLSRGAVRPSHRSAATAIGAVVGAMLGHAAIGPDKIGKPAKATLPDLAPVPPLAALRGFWNHFAENGPLTQGVTSGKSWKEDEHRKKYSRAELMGASLGDLSATVLAGASSVGIATHALGGNSEVLLKNPLVRFSHEVSITARFVNRIRDIGRVKDTLSKPTDAQIEALRLSDPRFATSTAEEVRKLLERHRGRLSTKYDEAVLAGSVIVAGLMVYDSYNAGENGKRPIVNGPISAALSGAAIAGSTAFFLKRSKAVPGDKLRLPFALFAGCGLVFSAYSTRGAFEAFSGDVSELRKKSDVGWKAQAGSSVVGAALGAATGFGLGRTLTLKGNRYLVGGLGALAGLTIGSMFAPVLGTRKSSPVDSAR